MIVDRMLKHQHGAGACVMFALDTSSSMQGTAFEQMKKVFTDIIDGTRFIVLRLRLLIDI